MAIGVSLPAIHGTTLAGTRLGLPQDCAGRPTLLIFGFYRESQGPLDAWARTLSKPGTPSSHLPLYVLPMMGNGPLKLMAHWVREQLKRQIPRLHHNKVVPIFEDLDPIKAGVNYTTKEKAYTLLIDAQGVIRGGWVGMPNAANTQAVQARVRALAEQLVKRPKVR